MDFLPKHILIIPTIIYSTFFIVGLMNILFPKFFWEKTEGWKATKEPSKLFFLMRRFQGIIVLIILFGLLGFYR